MTANAMLIRCLLKRPGGTTLTMADGGLIKFSPDENGDHVAMVSNPDYIQRLLGIPEGYAIHAMPGPVAHMPAPPKAAGIEPSLSVINFPADQAPVPPAHPAPEAAGAVAPVSAPEPVAAPDDASDLTALTDEQLRAVYRAEWNKEPHPKAKRETIIAQIDARREEAAK